MSKLPSRLRVPSIAVAALFAMTLSACGGGGGGDENVAGGPPPAPAPAPSPSPAPAPAPGQTTVSTLSQQMVPGGDYLVNATSAGTVDLTLPPSPAAGDTVTVTGASSNDWRILQNAGQYIDTTGLTGSPVLGANWTTVGPTDDSWWYTASSVQGRTMAAVSNKILGGLGNIYVSHDGGASWTTTESSGRNWASIAVTPDGTKMLAVGIDRVYLSTDSGDTWTPVTPTGTSAFLLSGTISSDGQHLAVVDKNGLIYVSADAGATWTPTASARAWESIAGSSSGQFLVAVASDGAAGNVWLSNDYGATWTAATAAGAQNWYRVASSADGLRLVAAADGGPTVLSTDGGATWTPVYAAAPVRQVTMSADGQRVALAIDSAPVQLSTDGGLTFSDAGPSSTWHAAALSGDGQRLIAGQAVTLGAGVSNPLHLSRGARTTVGTSGAVTGSQGDMIKLQYQGSGRFTVQSSTGSFVVQ